MEKEMMVGGMSRMGQQPPKAKEQTVIVSLPPQVKRYLTLMVYFNSLVWIVMGLTYWLSDGDLPMGAYVAFGIAIFTCVILLPVFINFIISVPWGQRSS